uniref:Secreted protein n=1 Tax=Cuerna arida TaxID=1464854 RepID=A0A1B6FDR2_9HEMI
MTIVLVYRSSLVLCCLFMLNGETAGSPVTGEGTRKRSLKQGKTPPAHPPLVDYNFEDAEVLYYDIKYNGKKRYMGRTTKKPRYYFFQSETIEKHLEIYEGDMNDDDYYENSDDRVSLWSHVSYDILFVLVILLTAGATIVGKWLKNIEA